MIALLSLLAVESAGGLVGLLLYVAIACIVIWAIWALINWTGVSIPEPVRIIAIALLCIVAIVLLFRAVGGLL